MPGVQDFDLSDVTDWKTPDGLFTKFRKWFGKKAVEHALSYVFLDIVAEGEYRRIVAENDRQRAYGHFIKIMDDVAKQRQLTCGANDLSDACPMSSIISQYYQKGRTSDGTAPLRLYTVIGADGEVVNVQGFDLSQTVLITVTHKNGTNHAEYVSPVDAIKAMRWLAGLGG
jgi:hypothetical protein